MSEVLGQQQSVTVILSTYNRAQCLLETLEAFCSLDINKLDVEFVVVDNNSSDHTAEVIKSFKGKLPLVHLFESKPGKNCALNHALKAVKLKYITVFTDDDVSPEADWLQQIVRSASDYPEYYVFGGHVEVKWPEGSLPEWCIDEWFHPIAFASHHLGDEDHAYQSGIYPFGPNMWIKSAIFEKGYLYNEDIGPRPTNRIMGSETSFLIGLARDGFMPLYVARSHIKHRIQPSEFNMQALFRRAFRYGRSQPHLARIREPQAVRVCFIKQSLVLIYNVLMYFLAYANKAPNKKFSSKFLALINMGRSSELIRLGIRGEIRWRC